MILVTGGAGFIGSTFVLQWIREEKSPVINLDKLTYAGNLSNLSSLEKNSLHTFIHGDICDRQLVHTLLETYQPQMIFHCAAESHVDRSIATPENFITTNIVGTSVLLEECLLYWRKLSEPKKSAFRFLYVSTDEVYGSLEENAPPSKEDDCYAPNSPYAASKASGAHLVRAYNRTYQLPTLTTCGTNTFGPRQFPEKLIPLALFRALEEKPIPIYGNGLNIRDWIFVEEHCDALRCVLKKGISGECYNIATGFEKTNLAVVNAICDLLDTMSPRYSRRPYSELITHIKDRPGHDKRYGLDTSKIQTQLGWKSNSSFEESLKNSISWYMENGLWVENVLSGAYSDWYKKHYLDEGLC